MLKYHPPTHTHKLLLKWVHIEKHGGYVTKTFHIIQQINVFSEILEVSM